MLEVEQEAADGIVRWSVLECARVSLSWAQFGHKGRRLLNDLIRLQEE